MKRRKVLVSANALRCARLLLGGVPVNNQAVQWARAIDRVMGTTPRPVASCHVGGGI